MAPSMHVGCRAEEKAPNPARYTGEAAHTGTPAGEAAHTASGPLIFLMLLKITVFF